MWDSLSELRSSVCERRRGKDSSEVCAIACQNCAVYSVFTSGMTSHSKIAQFNWECLALLWARRLQSLYQQVLDGLSAYVHALAVLTLRKIFRCALKRRLCGTQSRCGSYVKETNFLLLWRIESWYWTHGLDFVLKVRILIVKEDICCWADLSSPRLLRSFSCRYEYPPPLALLWRVCQNRLVRRFAWRNSRTNERIFMKFGIVAYYAWPRTPSTKVTRKEKKSVTSARSPRNTSAQLRDR